MSFGQIQIFARDDAGLFPEILVVIFVVAGDTNSDVVSFANVNHDLIRILDLAQSIDMRRSVLLPGELRVPQRWIAGRTGHGPSSS